MPLLPASRHDGAHRRTVDRAAFEPYAHVLQSWWVDVSHSVADLELYSTYRDALAGRNRWAASELPSALATYGKTNVAFFIEQSPVQAEADGVPVLQRSSSADCIGCIGTSDSVGLRGSFTLTAWLRPVQVQGVDSPVLSSEEDELNNRLMIGLRGDMPIMSFGTAREPCKPEASFDGLGDEWAHVAWRYDSNDQVMAMFVNGAQIADCGGRLAFHVDHTVTLGSSVHGVFAGHLRELKLFSEPVSTMQLAHIAGLRTEAWEWFQTNEHTSAAEGCWKRSYGKCVGNPRLPVRELQETREWALPAVYSYDRRRTPVVEGVSRTVGTTAGGTTVTIYGQDLGTAPDIYLSGVRCATERSDIGSYRGMHLCDWGMRQLALGQDDVAVDCSGLGPAPLCVANAAAECAAINTAPTLSDQGSIDNGQARCEANPACAYVDDECVAAAACSSATDRVSCEAIAGNVETCIDDVSTCEGYVQCEDVSTAVNIGGGGVRGGCGTGGVVGLGGACRSCEDSASTCPAECEVSGTAGVDERCTNIVTDCVADGYVQGTAASPSTSCPSGCVLTPAVERGCSWYPAALTCLSNPFPASDVAPVVGDVDVVTDEVGLASTAEPVEYSYTNLWSAKTTWGGNDPPIAGDSVVVTVGEHIIMDVSPPLLHLVILEGVLAFQDKQDLMLNASYIFIHGSVYGSTGRLQVGTEAQPFLHEAYITIHGNRASYEIPIYGTKCIGVRNGALDLHGRPQVKWTRLSETAKVGQTYIRLRQKVEWRPNDLIVIASTGFNQEESEPMRIKRLTDGGHTVVLTKPLKHEHLGDGWSSGNAYAHAESCSAASTALTDICSAVVLDGTPSTCTDAGDCVHTPASGSQAETCHAADAVACAAADLSDADPVMSREECEGVGDGLCEYHSGRGWSEEGDQIEEYAAEVGLLTSNVRVSGDMPVSRIEQFGVQIVWHARGHNAAVGRLSNVEVFNAGQGLKLGKYPIHFHMIGSVSQSYVRGTSVHHSFNRAITMHGVNDLRVQDNFVFDARGHAIFTEDGTETVRVAFSRFAYTSVTH